MSFWIDERLKIACPFSIRRVGVKRIPIFDVTRGPLLRE